MAGDTQESVSSPLFATSVGLLMSALEGEKINADVIKNDENQEDELYPLQMNYCPNCHNVQLSHSVPREKMFNEYLYVSSTTETFRKHFLDASNTLRYQF